MESINLKAGNVSITVEAFNKDGINWVAVKPLSDLLGLKWERQRTKLQQGEFSVTPHKGGTCQAADGKIYEMLCIPVKEVGLWLGSISIARTKPEVRQKLMDFRKNLNEAVYDYLTGTISREVVAGLQATIQALVARLDKSEARIAYLEKGDEIDASFAGKVLNHRSQANQIH